MNDRQADIRHFIQKGNEQEFIILRFLIGWGVASVAGIVGHFHHLIYFKVALFFFHPFYSFWFLTTSIFFKITSCRS
jgi:hypothetical protein